MPKSFDDLMNMSDEELMNTPNMVANEEKSEEEDNTSEEVEETSQTEEGDDDDDEEDKEENEEESSEESDDASDDDAGDKQGAEGSTSGSKVVKKDESNKSDKTKTADKKAETKSDDKSAKSEAGKTDSDKKTLAEAEGNQVIDYEAAYKQIMQPFKANGRIVNLNSPEEVIKLMQMGANYVKKMQAIQPNLKVLRMLENNQLLDEGKLSEVIDLMKGDKAALAKFVKDRNIDPMDIDPETAVDYKPGNHKVADSEINFQTTLEELGSSDAGQNLIIQMQHAWDAKSRQEVFKEPAHLKTLEQHMQAGIYDQIASEVEKQKALGHPQIASLPFIHAYELVGKALAQQGLLKVNQVNPAQGQPNAGNPIQQKAVQELGRGTAPKKKQDLNSKQAKAASPSAKSTKKASVEFNPLAGSDEEFLKSLENRV